MKHTSPEFKNSLKILVDNILDLSEWEQGFVKSVSQQRPELLTQKQMEKVMDVFKNYAKKVY